MSAEKVTVFEVGPRDGLQNLKHPVETSTKIALINALSQAGFRKIEAASFVNPNWVPQMADGQAVMSGITRAPAASYAALTPNLQGVKAAIKARCDEIAVFVSASEGFSQANLNCSIAESFSRLGPAIERAKEANLPVRAYLSCVVECPFDGHVSPATVATLSSKLLALGCYEVSLGDTIGTASPKTTANLLDAVCQSVPALQVAGHFHNTHGFAISNIETALEYGVRVFDSSVAGLGGCPYAPGATGNVDTRAVCLFLEKHGFETGIDLNVLRRAELIARGVSDF